MPKLLTSRIGAISITTVAILLSAFLVLWLVIGSWLFANSNISISREQYGAAPANQAPTRVTSNTSNIVREEYETALAKWNSLNVTEYEATVQHTGWGKWKIVVRVDPPDPEYVESVQATHSHKLIYFENLDSSVPELSVRDVELVTVGGQYDHLGDILYCQERSCEQGDFFTPLHYVVEFDQTMGYPRSISNGIVETKIENVKILK